LITASAAAAKSCRFADATTCYAACSALLLMLLLLLLLLLLSLSTHYWLLHCTMTHQHHTAAATTALIHQSPTPPTAYCLLTDWRTTAELNLENRRTQKQREVEGERERGGVLCFLQLSSHDLSRRPAASHPAGRAGGRKSERARPAVQAKSIAEPPFLPSLLAAASLLSGLLPGCPLGSPPSSNAEGPSRQRLLWRIMLRFLTDCDDKDHSANISALAHHQLFVRGSACGHFKDRCMPTKMGLSLRHAACWKNFFSCVNVKLHPCLLYIVTASYIAHCSSSAFIRGQPTYLLLSRSAASYFFLPFFSKLSSPTFTKVPLSVNLNAGVLELTIDAYGG
jgi:hypothetical protein